jgi:hypothetical protein
MASASTASTSEPRGGSHRDVSESYAQCPVDRCCSGRRSKVDCHLDGFRARATEFGPQRISGGFSRPVAAGPHPNGADGTKGVVKPVDGQMINASSKQAQAAGVTSPLPVICHVSWRVVPSRPSSRSCSEASRTRFWPIVTMFGLAERQSADRRSLSAFGRDCFSSTASLGVVLRSSRSTEQAPLAFPQRRAGT